MKGGRGEGIAAIESRSAKIRGDYVVDSDFVCWEGKSCFSYVADSNFVWWEGKSCFSYGDFVIFWEILVFNVVRVVCVTR